MNNKHPRKWTINDILEIIKSNKTEDKRLEFKSSDALDPQKKNEISKDISSFANSDGGIIIYGIKERKEEEKITLVLDEGFDLNGKISKEWLDNVIHSRISPSIEGIYINPIKTSKHKVIFLVYIPKSETAHMAGNNIYYKRRNFKSEPMEDYEVRDVMNRQKDGKLQMIVKKEKVGKEEKIKLIIKNVGMILVKNFAIRIFFPTVLFKTCIENEKAMNIRGRKFYRVTITEQDQLLFPGFDIEMRLDDFPAIDRVNLDKYRFFPIYWTIFSDNNLPKKGSIKLGKIK